MEIIKERSRYGAGKYVIRSNSYGSGLDKFLEFFAVAKRDFPSLEPMDVAIIQYGGRSMKGTWGLEFDLPEGADVNDGYDPIPQMELRL